MSHFEQGNIMIRALLGFGVCSLPLFMGNWAGSGSGGDPPKINFPSKPIPVDSYPPHFPKRNYKPSSGVPGEFDFIVKIIQLGGHGVGKSSLMLRFTEDTFSSNHMSTIGVDFKIVPPTEIQGQLVKFQLWDLAGPERFRTITTSYYRGASIMFVILDPSRDDAIPEAEHWLKDIEKHTTGCHVAIVVNKLDLRPDLMEPGWDTARLILSGARSSGTIWSLLPKELLFKILSIGWSGSGNPSRRDLEQFAKKHDKPIFYASAKTGEGVKEYVMDSANIIVKKVLQWETEQQS